MEVFDVVIDNVSAAKVPPKQPDCSTQSNAIIGRGKEWAQVSARSSPCKQVGR